MCAELGGRGAETRVSVMYLDTPYSVRSVLFKFCIASVGRFKVSGMKRSSVGGLLLASERVKSVQLGAELSRIFRTACPEEGEGSPRPMRNWDSRET